MSDVIFQRRQFHRTQIGKAQEYIRAHFEEPLSLEDIAREAGASTFHFSRLFLAYTNETIFDFLRRVRLEEALKRLCRTDSESVTDIGLSVGYSTPSSFNKVFKKTLAINPKHFRNLGKEEQKQLIYSVGRSKLHKEIKMNLDKNYDVIDRPDTYVAYFEGKGPFHETAPVQWDKLLKILPNFDAGQIREYVGFSIIDKTKNGAEVMVYQAGVGMNVKTTPSNIRGIHTKTVPAGKYARFILKGSYSQIWPAFNEIFKILAENDVKIRKEFCIENYLNDPKVTPEDSLLTEILIPVE